MPKPHDIAIGEHGIGWRYSDRVCSAAQTLQRVAPLLPGLGITRLARVTGLDRIGIPVWNAARPNAKSLSIHQGKGLTDDDARASATMEAVERAVAENLPIPRRTESKNALSSQSIRFDALECLLGLRQAPHPDHEPMDWVAAGDLLTGSPILVPADAVALDRTRPTRYWQSSDGLASGNSIDEAILHGLLERVERDADTLWSLKRKDARLRTRFDPGDLGDPMVDQLVDKIAAAELRLVLFDMTSDLGIPAVSALIGPAEGSAPRMRYVDAAGGSGSHPIAARATIRAITEAAQSRMTLISGARDDVGPERYEEDLSPSLRADLASPAAKGPPADLRIADQSASGLLSHVIDAVRIHTNRIYAVDLMPEENRLAVAKVIAPDLENPEGARRQRYGLRALARLTVF